jgi:hypothetical protein
MDTATKIHNSSITVKHKNGGMWEMAIAHLERELETTNNSTRVRQIDLAINTFQAKIKAGETWPGMQAKGQD